MKTSPEFLTALAERLGWALLHSVWQGALIAVALAVALRSLGRHRAATRHAACLLGMIVLAASVAGTAWRVNPASIAALGTQPFAASVAHSGMKAEPTGMPPAPDSAPTFPSETASSLDRASSAPTGAAIPWARSLRENFEPLLPWITATWMIGVALFTLRHFVGWHRLRALRRSGMNARPELQRTFTRLLEKFGRTAGVRLLESVDAVVPMLAGLFKPAVLLPLRVISGLREQEIEAILAHELAHLVRRDAWSNLAQVAIETLLFYHPAIWWIGRCARQERENAADDLALDVCADRRVYAVALAQLAEMRLDSQAALAATGGSLLARIRRIVRPTPVESPSGDWSLGIPALLTALALAAIFRTQAEQVEPLDAAPNSDAKKVALETTAEATARIEVAFQSVLARSSNWAASADAILPMPTFATRNTGAALEVEPVVGPDSYTIDLCLVPQAVEFEGFINYGSPIATASPAFNALGVQIGSTQTVITPNVINQPIFSTRKVTTSVSIFDGQAVVLGGLVLQDAWNVVLSSTSDHSSTEKQQPKPTDPEAMKLNNNTLRSTVAAIALATGAGTSDLSAEEAAALREKVAALEKRISDLEGNANPDRKLERLREENKLKARTRASEDRGHYKPEELSEIESLYQVANKNWRTDEARESLKKLLAKFDRSNRTGCATLYMGQMSDGQDRVDYLTRAVEKFSDCYYFDGCQVGGYGRYVLALTLWEKGEKDKARALLAELKTTYKDATDHRGRPMSEVAEAAEKELAAKQ